MAPWSIIYLVSFVVNNTCVSVLFVFWLLDSYLFYPYHRLSPPFPAFLFPLSPPVLHLTA